MLSVSVHDVVLIHNAVTWVCSFLQFPLQRQFSVAPAVEEPLKSYLSESGRQKKKSQTIKKILKWKLYKSNIFFELLPHCNAVNMCYWPSVRSRWLDIGQIINEFLHIYLWTAIEAKVFIVLCFWARHCITYSPYM